MQILCSSYFPGQGAHAGGVYPYPPPAHQFVVFWSQCSDISLGCLALGVPVLVVNAAAAVFHRLCLFTPCFIKVLLNRRVARLNFSQNSHLVSPDVNGGGFVRDPQAFTVTNGVFPPVAPVLRVSLPPGGSVHHHGIPDVILHEVQRWWLQRCVVAQENSGRVVASLLPQEICIHWDNWLEVWFHIFLSLHVLLSVCFLHRVLIVFLNVYHLLRKLVF